MEQLGASGGGAAACVVGAHTRVVAPTRFLRRRPPAQGGASVVLPMPLLVFVRARAPLAAGPPLLLLLGLLLLEGDLGSSICPEPVGPMQRHVSVRQEILATSPVCCILLEDVVDEVRQDGHSVGFACQVLGAKVGAQQEAVDCQNGAVPWQGEHLGHLSRPHGRLEGVEIRDVG